MKKNEIINLVDSYIELDSKIKALEKDKEALKNQFLADHEKHETIVYNGTIDRIEINIPKKCLITENDVFMLCADNINLYRSLVKIDLKSVKKQFGENKVLEFGQDNDTPRILIKKSK